MGTFCLHEGVQISTYNLQRVSGPFRDLTSFPNFSVQLVGEDPQELVVGISLSLPCHIIFPLPWGLR